MYDELPWPPVGQDFKKHTIGRTIWIDGWCLEKGTKIKLKQTTDFGWIWILANDVYPKSKLIRV